MNRMVLIIKLIKSNTEFHRSRLMECEEHSLRVHGVYQVIKQGMRIDYLIMSDENQNQVKRERK